MDLTTLTPEERQAAEQAVAVWRAQNEWVISYFPVSEYVDGVISPGCIAKGSEVIAYLTEGSEGFAPALLTGLKLIEATDKQLIELAVREGVLSIAAWERGEVQSGFIEEHDFKDEFIAFLNALRNL